MESLQKQNREPECGDWAGWSLPRETKQMLEIRRGEENIIYIENRIARWWQYIVQHSYQLSILLNPIDSDGKVWREYIDR